MATSAARTTFEAAYADHVREILAYCLRRTSEAQAEDAAAEVFAVAWRRVSELPAEPQTLPGLADEQPEQGTTLSCDHDSLAPAQQAVDGTPIPTTTSFTIMSLGISEINETYGTIDYTTVGRPFGTWMRANRPDDAANVGFRTWTSIEDARSNGALQAKYAQEWPTYLEANGCAYNDGC